MAKAKRPLPSAIGLSGRTDEKEQQLEESHAAQKSEITLDLETDL